MPPNRFAAGPDQPDHPTPGDPSPDEPSPSEPEIVPPSEPPTEPDPGPPPEPYREPPTVPDPETLPPGVPFQNPDVDVPDGPGISDPDLAPSRVPGAPHGGYTAFASASPLPTDRMDGLHGVVDDEVPFDTAPVSPDHPAYDRVQRRSEAKRTRRGPLLGIVVAVVLVAVGLVAAWLAVRPGADPDEAPDLLAIAAAHADAVRPDVVTSDLDEAQQFILGEFGWPIRVPVLPDARLAGVGVEALAEGVEVPVLAYETAEGASIVVYAYDYAFLDAAADRLQLAAPVYARLADDPPVDVRRVGDAYLVLWRRRAAIYTAVTASDPASLVEYLRSH